MPKAIMLLGAWNAGKSFLSMSASSKYPALPWQPFTPLNPKPKDWTPVDLSDVFVHAWEPDCFAGFVDGGLSVPPHWDMSSVTGPELDSTIDAVNVETTQRVKSGQTSIVVVDTVSAFNTHAYSWAFYALERVSKEDDTAKTTDTNMQKVWGSILQRHKRYLTGIFAANPKLVIFNCHPKVADPNFRGSKNDAAAQELHKVNLKAKGIGDQATLTPEITGQAMGEYIRDCSIVAYIEAAEKSVPRPGKPAEFVKQVTRTLSPHKKNDVLARSKYSCLSEKEPADLRVIFQKIRGEDAPSK